jgi:hypothetical protein
MLFASSTGWGIHVSGMLVVGDTMDYHGFFAILYASSSGSSDPSLQRWRSAVADAGAVDDLPYARLYMWPTEAHCRFCPQTVVACLSVDVSKIGMVLPEVRWRGAQVRGHPRVAFTTDREW